LVRPLGPTLVPLYGTAPPPPTPHGPPFTGGLEPTPSTTGAHHRLSPWKTQCAPSIPSAVTVYACPWNVKASTQCGHVSCAGLRAHLWDNQVRRPSPSTPPLLSSLGTDLHTVSPPVSPDSPEEGERVWERGGGRPPGVERGRGGGRREWPTDRLRGGRFGVEGMAAPEVKFLDRCQTHSSEGVLQVRVRRSRMRVWGAKTIRHRRSPQP